MTDQERHAFAEELLDTLRPGLRDTPAIWHLVHKAVREVIDRRVPATTVGPIPGGPVKEERAEQIRERAKCPVFQGKDFSVLQDSGDPDAWYIDGPTFHDPANADRVAEFLRWSLPDVKSLLADRDYLVSLLANDRLAETVARELGRREGVEQAAKLAEGLTAPNRAAQAEAIRELKEKVT